MPRLQLILALLMIPSMAVAGALSSEDQRIVRDALELHYINAEIYWPVRCRDEDVGGRLYIFCSKAGGKSDIGGLFTARRAGGELEIQAVNGKAIQHTSRSGGLIEAVDTTLIPVSRWSGASIDIPKVIGAIAR